MGCSGAKEAARATPPAPKLAELPKQFVTVPKGSETIPKEPVPEPNAEPKLEPVVDSDMTRSSALKGVDCPAMVKQRQALVDVSYYSFDQRLHRGQILIDEDLANDVKAIFKEIEESRFPIAKVVPVCRYGWSDEASMAADNSSGFNYRNIPESSRLSEHAYGRAIDLNPVENPFMDPHKGKHRTYDPHVPGAITASSAPTRAFLRHGWHWGGFWRHAKDYQHFEK
jgi:hypothetical protein